MDPLEHFYQFPPIPKQTYKRKVSLPKRQNFHLYGVRGSGKSTAILEWLSQKKEGSFLYLDLESPAFLLQPLDTFPLQSFIEENGIDTLVFDHYEPGMIEEFPRVDQLILITRSKRIEYPMRSIKLDTLSFGELVSIFSNEDPSLLFNRLLKHGTLPAAWIDKDLTSARYKHLFQHLFTPNEQALFLTLSNHHMHTVSIHQIYTFAKEYFKVSKDWIYRTIKNFEAEGVICFLPNKMRKSGKKLLLFDPALASYLATEHPFGVRFDALVALHILQRKTDFEALGIHGYLITPHTLVMPAPFESEERYRERAQRDIALFKSHQITHVRIVTVSNRFAFTLEEITFEACPFQEWALSEVP